MGNVLLERGRPQSTTREEDVWLVSRLKMLFVDDPTVCLPKGSSFSQKGVGLGNTTFEPV